MEDNLALNKASGSQGIEKEPNEIFCSSCRLRFEDLTSYKLHLTTEFHVYNARRRTAELAPISQKLFEQKRKELLSCMTSEQSEKDHYCKYCKRLFQSQETYEQHLNSKKHKQKEKVKRKNSSSTIDGASDIKQDSEINNSSSNPFEEEFENKTLTENSKIEEPRKTSMDSLRICMFCNQQSEGVKKNMDHMRINHSFFILDIDCLISLKALLHYLAEKIHVGHNCIYCTKNFKDVTAVQKHMKDLAHCCMNSQIFEDEYEYFYDFSPTYEENFVGKQIEDFDLSEEPLAKPITEKIFTRPDEEMHDQSDLNQELKESPMEEIKEYEGEDNEKDEEWEDVDVEDEDNENTGSITGSYQKVSVPSTSSFTLVKTHTESQSLKKENLSQHTEEIKSMAAESNIAEDELAKLLERRKKRRFDYEKITDTYKKAEVLDTGEVKLPNGKIIGHRKWAREYKQRLNLRDEKEKLVMQKLGIEYGKLGTVAVQQHFNHSQIMMRYNINKNSSRSQKYDLNLGMKGNKVNTTHFRCQIN